LLQAWEISDVNPDRIHVTVGKRRRIERRGGEGYVLHHQDLEPAEVTWWQQLPVTDVPTTIGQCVAWRTPRQPRMIRRPGRMTAPAMWSIWCC
jgi:predicted transcriptional regulator of viral defense system